MKLLMFFIVLFVNFEINSQTIKPSKDYHFGKLSDIIKAISGTNITVTRPVDSSKFRIRAKDVEKGEVKFLRVNDTEPQALLNTMLNHWSLSNDFKMVFTSKIYPCNSCKQFIIGFMNHSKKVGKNLEIEIIAHPDVNNGTDFIQNVLK